MAAEGRKLKLIILHQAAVHSQITQIVIELVFQITQTVIELVSPITQIGL